MGRGRLVGLGTMLLALLLAGCAAPQFTYVTNSSQHTYFKVPDGWSQIASSKLYAAVKSTPQSGVWSVGYDGDVRPAADHVLGAQNAQPFVYSVVAPVNQVTSNAVSYNELRDFFLPVTAAGRATAAKSGFPLTGFRLLRDTTLTLGQGVHGVRVTFDYTYPGIGGSSELVRRDPQTLMPLGLVVARLGGQRIGGLNDLEWAGGRVWANVAPRQYLAGIDPGSGEVVDIVDARAAGERHWSDPEAFLNGVTALPAPGEFLLSGKGWRSLYHVRLIEGRRHKQPERLLAG